MRNIEWRKYLAPIAFVGILLGGAGALGYDAIRRGSARVDPAPTPLPTGDGFGGGGGGFVPEGSGEAIASPLLAGVGGDDSCWDINHDLKAPVPSGEFAPYSGAQCIGRDEQGRSHWLAPIDENGDGAIDKWTEVVFP